MKFELVDKFLDIFIYMKIKIIKNFIKNVIRRFKNVTFKF